MENIYTIRAEFGQWEDAQRIPMYVATDEQAARARLQSLADEFSAAYAVMVEAMAHGMSHHDADLNTINEHVAQVARWTYWDEGVALSLWVEPVGKVFNGPEYLDRVGVSFFPEGWDEDRVEREGEELFASKYELMAEPYEQKYGA